MTVNSSPEIRPHVAVIDGAIKTNSLKIAEHFGKRHDHIIRDIGKIIEQTADLPEAPKFGDSEYEYQNNLGLMAKAKMYEMDKDGFMLVVMGYTGSKAMAIKVAYINAFNAMERQLLAGLSAPQNPPYLTFATKEQRRPVVQAVRRLVRRSIELGRPLQHSDVHTIINLHLGIADIEHLPESQVADALQKVGELMEHLLSGEYLPAGVADSDQPSPDDFDEDALGLRREAIIQTVQARLRQILPRFKSLSTMDSNDFHDMAELIASSAQRLGLLDEECLEHRIDRPDMRGLVDRFIAYAAKGFMSNEMPKNRSNEINVPVTLANGLAQIRLHFSTDGANYGRWLVTLADGEFVIRPLESHFHVVDSTNVADYIRHGKGGVVKREYLPDILQATAARINTMVSGGVM